MTTLALKAALAEASVQDRKDFLKVILGYLREIAAEYADDILLALADELEAIAQRSSGVARLALGLAVTLARFAADRTAGSGGL